MTTYAAKKAQAVREDLKNLPGRFSVRIEQPYPAKVRVTWSDGPTAQEVRRACRSVGPRQLTVVREPSGALLATVARQSTREVSGRHYVPDGTRLLEVAEKAVAGEDTVRDRLLAKIVEADIVVRPSRGRDDRVTPKLVAWRTSNAQKLLAGDDDAVLEVTAQLVADSPNRTLAQVAEMARAMVNA